MSLQKVLLKIGEVEYTLQQIISNHALCMLTLQGLAEQSVEPVEYSEDYLGCIPDYSKLTIIDDNKPSEAMVKLHLGLRERAKQVIVIDDLPKDSLSQLRDAEHFIITDPYKDIDKDLPYPILSKSSAPKSKCKRNTKYKPGIFHK